MKIIVVENNYRPDAVSDYPGWYVVADSALSNTGKPFYLPEEPGRMEACLAIALRINRLGKGVEPRFASRYYSEYAPAVHFRLPDLKKELESRGLPADPSRNFDKALFVGEFKPLENLEPLKLKINGNVCTGWDLKNLISSPEEIVSRISRLNTIKIGDMIIPALSAGLIIGEGDLLEVETGNEGAFQVRVK